MKIVVVGGMIESKYDKQMHHISADKLAWLYNLKPSECVMITDRNDPYSKSLIKDPENIVLGPRYHGDYIPHLKERREEHDQSKRT